jgi:hypothetical protein
VFFSAIFRADAGGYACLGTNDGGAYGKGGGGPANDQIHISKFLNNENIDGQDVVLWYRAGARHGGTIHQAMVGPTLRPFGPGWSK